MTRPALDMLSILIKISILGPSYFFVVILGLNSTYVALFFVWFFELELELVLLANRSSTFLFIILNVKVKVEFKGSGFASVQYSCANSVSVFVISFAPTGGLMSNQNANWVYYPHSEQ